MDPLFLLAATMRSGRVVRSWQQYSCSIINNMAMIVASLNDILDLISELMSQWRMSVGVRSIPYQRALKFSS
jgi:hypothetical protein